MDTARRDRLVRGSDLSAVIKTLLPRFGGNYTRREAAGMKMDLVDATKVFYVSFITRNLLVADLGDVAFRARILTDLC